MTMLEPCKNVGKGGFHKYDVYEHTLTIRDSVQAFFMSNIIHIPHYSDVVSFFTDTIDGITKKDLFLLAVLLHDTGKPLSIESTGKMKEHVKYSLELVAQNYKAIGLTTAQYEYVSAIVGRHHAYDTTLPNLNNITQDSYDLETGLLSYFDKDATRGEKFYQLTEQGIVLGEAQMQESLSLLIRIITVLFV